MLCGRGLSRLLDEVCPKSMRFVSRQIDDVLFKEDDVEKHTWRILPTIPRPSTTIPQVPPGSRPPGHWHARPLPPDPRPTPGTPVTPNLHPAARMKPGGGGASVDSPVSGRPPSPFSMLAHARNIGGWRVEVQGHVTALWGRACPRRGVGVSGGTCTMAFDGRGSVACSFPRHPSWKQHVCVGGRLPVQHGVPTVNPNLLVTSVHD